MPVEILLGSPNDGAGALLLGSPRYSSAPTFQSIGEADVVTDGSTLVPGTGSGLAGATLSILSGAITAAQADLVVNGEGTSFTFTATRGNLPYSTASHAHTARIETANGIVERDVTYNPAAGFRAVEMGADVATDDTSLWYPFSGADPVQADQLKHPLKSRLGADVSVDSRGVPSLDYTNVQNADDIAIDYLDGVEAWSEGGWSGPVTKTVYVENAALPHSEISLSSNRVRSFQGRNSSINSSSTAAAGGYSLVETRVAQSEVRAESTAGATGFNFHYTTAAQSLVQTESANGFSTVYKPFQGIPRNSECAIESSAKASVVVGPIHTVVDHSDIQASSNTRKWVQYRVPTIKRLHLQPGLNRIVLFDA